MSLNPLEYYEVLDRVTVIRANWDTFIQPSTMKDPSLKTKAKEVEKLMAEIYWETVQKCSLVSTPKYSHMEDKDQEAQEGP